MLSQGNVRPVDTGLDGCGTTSEDLGKLLVAHVAEVGQPNQLPLLFGEGFEGSRHGFAKLVGHQGLFWVRRLICGVERIILVGERFDRYRLRAASLGTAAVQEAPVRDLEEPSVWSEVGSSSVANLIGSHENFLRQVGRVLAVTGEFQQEAVDPGIHRLNEFFEGFL